MSNSTNIALLVGVGSSDFGGSLTNALQVAVAGEYPAYVSFLNDTGGTLYGVLVQSAALPDDGAVVVDAVKLLAGERKTIEYPFRNDVFVTGCWAALSSTVDELTIAGSTAGIIFKINFPTP